MIGNIVPMALRFGQTRAANRSLQATRPPAARGQQEMLAEAIMKATHGKTILAGIAADLAMNLAMLFTFRLMGFGWNGGGILLESFSQSRKLIAVWTEMEPIPLVVNSPAPIIA
jgi:hypothetical protein